MTREPTEMELCLIEIVKQERQFWADGIPSYPINFVRRFVAAMNNPSPEMIDAFITTAHHRPCNRSLVLDGFRSMLAAACPPDP